MKQQAVLGIAVVSLFHIQRITTLLLVVSFDNTYPTISIRGRV